ncbi:MAG: FtsX-like permease family protein [Candidatus Bathyarchaeia archaeon]
MMASDILSYALGAIKLRKLRAGLTTLGVVIGIAAIVALLSITQGLQVAITSQLQRGLATDTLIVSAGGSFGAGNSRVSLLINDTDIINGIQNVTTSSVIIQRVGFIERGGQTIRVTIVGINFAVYKEIYSSTFAAEDGDIPANPEDDMIVVGKRVSNPWNNETIFCRVGDSVAILWTNTTSRPLRNETYTGRVVAVLQEVGGFSIGGPSDSSIYIPLERAASFFGTDKCEMIIVKLRDGDKTTVDGVSKAIRRAFGGEVTVTSPAAILNVLSSVFATVELFLAGIASISLLVAGIGIMNIMIVSTMERTREIGILKALGMKNRTVLLIFLSEAIIIGVIGALIGLGAGYLLAQVAVRIFSGDVSFASQGASVRGAITITPVLTPTVILGAVVFGILVSIVFGLYPAWRASKLRPVEALRYE